MATLYNHCLVFPPPAVKESCSGLSLTMSQRLSSRANSVSNIIGLLILGRAPEVADLSDLGWLHAISIQTTHRARSYTDL